MSDLAGLPQRLKMAMRRAGAANLRQFAKIAGASYMTLRGIEQGATPKADTVVRITQAADVSADWLLTGREPEPGVSNPLTPDERELLEGWRHLDEIAKSYVLGVIEGRKSRRPG